MKNIQGKYIKWKATKGKAPYIEEYQNNFKNKKVLLIINPHIEILMM